MIVSLRLQFISNVRSKVNFSSLFSSFYFSSWNTLGYFILLMSSSLCILMGSLLANFKIRKLAFRTWLPYDYSTASAFLLAFAYQVVVATVCTFACVASDTLYSGLLIHISCQFEILEHRLKNIGSDKNYTMKQCVRHHNHIYKSVCQFMMNFDKLSNIYIYILEFCRYGEMVNDAFQSIMFFQFCTSLSMICFNFYRIMQIEMDSRYVGTILYMVCSLMQIFYYCWFSNEVKLKVRYCQAKIITRCDFFSFFFFILYRVWNFPI